MGRGELENRDAEEIGRAGLPTLGELSEELAAERGELDSYATRQLTGDVPADMQAQSSDRAQIARTGIGSPKIDYTVRSVYDSRPLNGRDFNLWFDGQTTDEIHSPDSSILQKIWQVPQGLIAVIRKFVILQTATGFSSMFDGTCKLLVDNVVKEPPTVRLGPPVLFNALTQEPIPYTSGKPIETFIIADENQFVGLEWNPIDMPEFFGVQGQYARFGFMGNFLQKTGVPAPFQVCNKAGQAYTADVLSPDFGPSGADFLTRRRRKYDPYAAIPLVNTPK